jgi:hypothetical protein
MQPFFGEKERPFYRAMQRSTNRMAILDHLRVAAVFAAVSVFAQLVIADTLSLGDIRTVAVSDQQFVLRPGIQLSVGNLFAPVINNDGNAAFVSETTLGQVLWRERSGQLTATPATVMGVSAVYLTETEDLVFTRSGGQTLKWGATGVTLLTGPGTPVVDENGNPIPNFTYIAIGIAAFHPSGRIVYSGSGKTPPVTFPEMGGYWTSNGLPNDLRMLLKYPNQQIPGEPPGTVFPNTTAYSLPKVNSGGATVMSTVATSPAGEYDVLVTDRGGSLDVLYRSDDQLPGQPQGVTFNSISRFVNPVINNQGDIAFSAGIHRGFNDDTAAILADRQGALDIVAELGTAVQNPTGDWHFSRLHLGAIAINGDGLVALRGSLTDVGRSFEGEGIAVEEPNGQLRLVVVDGMPVPGGPADAVFDVDRNQDFQFNRLSQMALTGSFQVPGGGRETGAFVYDPIRGLLNIALPGDQIEVAPGDIRQVFSASILGTTTGLEDGTRMALNEQGQVLFLARFTDSTSGLFVSDLVAVPEPATLQFVLLGVAAFTLRAARRRRPSAAASVAGRAA